jgi:hypothetical protein
MSNWCKRISGLCVVVAWSDSTPNRTNLPPSIREVRVGIVQSVHRLCLQAAPSSSPIGPNQLRDFYDRGKKAGTWSLPHFHQMLSLRISLPLPILGHMSALRAETYLSYKLKPSFFQFSDQKWLSILVLSHACYVTYQLIGLHLMILRKPCLLILSLSYPCIMPCIYPLFDFATLTKDTNYKADFLLWIW